MAHTTATTTWAIARRGHNEHEQFMAAVPFRPLRAYLSSIKRDLALIAIRPGQSKTIYSPESEAAGAVVQRHDRRRVAEQPPARGAVVMRPKPPAVLQTEPVAAQGIVFGRSLAR